MSTMPRRMKPCLSMVMMIILALSSFFCQWYLHSDFISGRGDESFNTTILLWHWPFGKSYSLSGDVCLEHYGIPGCLLVDNRDLFSKADFVVFHNRELVAGQQELPLHLTRPPGQRWVWMSLESPENNGNLGGLGGHFNCVMTYRRDADISIPYGKLVPKEAESGRTADDFIPKEKNSLVCWVVSNYSKQLKRTAVYEKLKKIIHVDVYGKAGGKPLDAQSLLPTISHCYFYLAFENSIFKDYITEKLWHNAFMGGAVPVVLGPPREQYEAVAPKDSFIHVDDFRSVEELGEFLKKLAEDKARYAAYFAWKHQYAVKLLRDWRERLCAICPKRSTLQLYKVYQDLSAI